MAEQKNFNRRDRIFTSDQKTACWNKSEVVPGRDPSRWRKDAVGNVVLRRLTNCLGCMCHEYDHIIPYSKGGETSVENCQILQTQVNRLKSNRTDLDSESLKKFSCATQFSERELDLVELAVYGDIKKTDGECVCKTVQEMAMANKKFAKN